jgi:uncharacterized ion transporter superfamily protein YfcC
MIILLILVAAANYWLLFYAPKMKESGQVNFVLVKLEEKPKEEPKEKPEEEMTWKRSLIIYMIAVPIIWLSELYPATVGLAVCCLVFVAVILKGLMEFGIVTEDNIENAICWIVMKLFIPIKQYVKKRQHKTNSVR